MGLMNHGYMYAPFISLFSQLISGRCMNTDNSRVTFVMGWTATTWYVIN